ncbi:hypothetical protein G0U57_006806 [Chelydra serpentina]|uniref:Uncharacterized protein n=1 Tax=Chelydra serpentina TaxID=8475 RepID=A0A8T1SJP7_CHESE|nr:hypothetical protein G0U57_006806 [Chelydra serpentina]
MSTNPQLFFPPIQMLRGRSSVVDVPSDGLNQPVTRVKLTVIVHKDLLLGHYGFEISPNPPLTIASVAAGRSRPLPFPFRPCCLSAWGKLPGVMNSWQDSR